MVGRDYVNESGIYYIPPGIYIMQNTMVRGGGGKWPAGEKNKIRKIWKGERKKEENYI